MSLFDVSGRKAIVTGANIGIYQGIALALAKAEAALALVGTSAAEKTKRLVEAKVRKAMLIDADLIFDRACERCRLPSHQRAWSDRYPSQQGGNYPA